MYIVDWYVKIELLLKKEMFQAFKKNLSEITRMGRVKRMEIYYDKNF